MFVGHKMAIVSDEPGTTRDVSEFEYTDEDTGLTYVIADSGGLDFWGEISDIKHDITDRTAKAIEESDLIIWVIEYDRVTDLDEKILEILRKKKVKNVFLVANKADNEAQEMEAYSLAWFGGFEKFFPVSVSHNKGINEIKREVLAFLKKNNLEYSKEEYDDSVIKLAIVGRPNVGKSSIINGVLGHDRVLVRDMDGTTRDSIDTKFNHGEKEFVLIDTAWIRRLSKIGTRNIENWSVMRTDRAMHRADVVAIVIDGFDGIHQQDLSIISTVLEEQKGLIVVINKWDKVLAKPGIDKENIMDRYIWYLRQKIEFIPWVSVIFTSATEKKRLDEILERAIEIKAERAKRVKTSILNEFIEQVTYKHAPSGNKKSHNPKIYFGNQVDVNPPKFVFSVNNPKHFHFSYKRYLENRIRDTFGFQGTPILIELRGRGKNKGEVG
jgi:GTPase